MLAGVVHDFRYALRILRKSPRLAVAAIATLALGIGASTVIFSVVYNAFFEALPYKDFRRSVVWQLHNTWNSGDRVDRNYFSAEEIRAFRQQNQVFEDIIAYVGIRPLYDDGSSSRYWPFGALVSANTFAFFGVAPLLGRGISPDDGKPGATPVFVMNYRFWQQEFGGDPTVLGRIFVLNGTPTTLIGIMPPQFNAFTAKFWIPATFEQLGSGSRLIGRLKPSVTIHTATVELNEIAHRLHTPGKSDGFRGQRFPEEHFVIVAQTLLESLLGAFAKTLYILLAAVFLLMLLACGNVANLLLARATAREKEIALCATLGATRPRLLRQLLAECCVLTVAACVSGWALAYCGVRAVRALIPNGELPDQTVIRMNLPVLLLSVGLTVLTTFACGLSPAFHVLRTDLQPRLTGNGPRFSKHFGSGRLRAALVVGEVALSIVLLIGAGLLMRSFFVLTHVDLGFNPHNILYFELELPKQYNTEYPDSLARKNSLTRGLLERLRSLPGVTSVSEQNNMPPLEHEATDIIIPGKPHEQQWETFIEECSEGYFSLLSLPLLRGSVFSESDVANGRQVVVVNQAFSSRYFPGEDPIGRKVKFALFDMPYLAAPRDTYFEIIGVVANITTRDYDKSAWQSPPQAFVPFSVANYSWRSFLLKTSVDPNSLLKDVSGELTAIAPGVRIYKSTTLEAALREFYRPPQFELLTLTAFASIGLLLMIAGVFSVMAYTVSLRTREVGIRMALGATGNSILGLVLLDGLSLLLAGTAIGTLAAFSLTRFLATEISGVSPTDPETFAAVALLVVLIGLVACLLPARHAALVEPVVALRYE